MVILKLAEYAPSRVLRRRLMLDVEEHYFYTVLLEIEELCEQIGSNIFDNRDILDAMQSGVIICDDPTSWPLIEFQDFEYCEKITKMLLEQEKYFSYVEQVVTFIYGNVPYLTEWNGDDLSYWKINKEKLFDDFIRYLNSEESYNEILTEDRFFEIALGLE